MHNAATEDGKPDSLAADILDDDQPNHESIKFLLMLAASAKAHGCITGIAWGLTQEDRDTIRSAIASLDFEAKSEVGWDPCHVQIGGISVQEARNGARPSKTKRSGNSSSESHSDGSCGDFSKRRRQMPPLRRSKHWLSPRRASDFYSSARSCSLHYQSPLSSSLGDGPITVPGAIFRA